ncbi:PEP-CTERM sorting domain-containing protein [Massilia sp. S19_KUP03_FR1]|uniref:PEP-CTERM sorting domain-containing protein n=1 Tax=Massilia sp. S19_KUP03_FR1 TaxID=3025503 RepID=UPI002FCDDF68
MTNLMAAACIACFGMGTAQASLATLQTYIGNVGYSSDGFGSTSQSGMISALVPVGSTVLSAYLYTSTNGNSTLSGVGGTLAGSAVTYTSLGTAGDSLTAGRTDVTSIIKPLIDGGAGGVYDFAITETSYSQDGEALVVVYSNPLLGISTVGIMDGFSTPSGDTTAINFAAPINPSAAGFSAEMILGVGFSCCSQASTVAVNGTTITTVAGNDDDGVGGTANGALISVGGFDDAYSPLLPTYDADHERYDIAQYITAGDTSIALQTINPSGDDNIFLSVFKVTGVAAINAPAPADVPEPGSLALFLIALLGMGCFARYVKPS